MVTIDRETFYYGVYINLSEFKFKTSDEPFKKAFDAMIIAARSYEEDVKVQGIDQSLEKLINEFVAFGLSSRFLAADSEMEVFEKCRGKAVFEHAQWFGRVVGEFHATWFTENFLAKQVRLDPEAERVFFENLDDLYSR
jgi:hypothetical protein